MRQVATLLEDSKLKCQQWLPVLTRWYSQKRNAERHQTKKDAEIQLPPVRVCSIIGARFGGLIFGAARFRVKKKHKTIALERTVSDLTGRAEELEREVGDLRRENGWLKEIVMLKGTQNISNNRLALRQAVALATDQGTSGIESTSQEGVSEGSSSELSDGEASVKQSKGHQKSRSTKP